ncbi:MAG: DUF2784 domain-containing protein [Arenicella sp.]
MIYTLLANVVLAVHVSIVFFVVFMVPLVFMGHALRWRWVRFLWLRACHLLCIFVVSLQAWAGIVCPLTTLEMWLRKQALLSTYSGSFIQYWLQTFLYWDLPSWVFILLYSMFTLLVLATWFIVPPRRVTFSSPMS